MELDAVPRPFLAPDAALPIPFRLLINPFTLPTIPLTDLNAIKPAATAGISARIFSNGFTPSSPRKSIYSLSAFFASSIRYAIASLAAAPLSGRLSKTPLAIETAIFAPSTIRRGIRCMNAFAADTASRPRESPIASWLFSIPLISESTSVAAMSTNSGAWSAIFTSPSATTSPNADASPEKPPLSNASDNL